MDPKHRDRIAFVRVCSGKFERDMSRHSPADVASTVRLSSSHKLFGQERETVDEAWPGDVIGLVGHDVLRHRRHAHRGQNHSSYDEIPRFPPEVFTFIANPNPVRREEIPRRPRATPAGRRRPVDHPARRHDDLNAPGRRRRRCSSKSCSSASRANTAPRRASIRRNVDHHEMGRTR